MFIVGAFIKNFNSFPHFNSLFEMDFSPCILAIGKELIQLSDIINSSIKYEK